MSNETVLPAVGSLTITLTDVAFINSGDNKMVIVGQTPTVLTVREPATGSASLTGQQVTRGFGLRLAGQGISGGITHNRSTGGASLNISSDVPQTVIASPPNKTLAPTTGSVGIASDLITIQVISISPNTGTVAISGIAPTVAVDDPTKILILQHPDVILSGKTPTISIDYVGAGETMILNPNATTDSLNRYNICSRSGFRVKPGELVKDGYGEMVRPESAEPRHMQERVKSQPESQKGALRPEPLGDSERFIDVEYPNGVDPDTDL